MAATINQTLTQNHAGNIVRMAIGLVVALAVTASLFWVMQYLIATADRSLNEDAAGTMLDFVRVKRDESIERLTLNKHTF